jgi:excisionase family DNA binding protein
MKSQTCLDLAIGFQANFIPAEPAAGSQTPTAPPVDGRPQSGRSGPNGSTPVPLALTIEEAAAVLNVSTKTIRRLLDRQILTASKALRKKLIPRTQIEGFLKATCDAPKSIL